MSSFYICVYKSKAIHGATDPKLEKRLKKNIMYERWYYL